MSTITEYFKRAPKPSEVVSAVQSDFTNWEKKVVKQLSEKEESVKKRGKYRTWSVTGKLEIGFYAIRHGVASTLRYFSSKYPGISTQSISSFKKVCYMSVKVLTFICFYGYEKNDCHIYICLPYFKVWNFH